MRSRCPASATRGKPRNGLINPLPGAPAASDQVSTYDLSAGRSRASTRTRRCSTASTTSRRGGRTWRLSSAVRHFVCSYRSAVRDSPSRVTSSKTRHLLLDEDVVAVVRGRRWRLTGGRRRGSLRLRRQYDADAAGGERRGAERAAAAAQAWVDQQPEGAHPGLSAFSATDALPCSSGRCRSSLKKPISIGAG